VAHAEGMTEFMADYLRDSFGGHVLADVAEPHRRLRLVGVNRLCLSAVSRLVEGGTEQDPYVAAV
jgi:hypothetical protein